MTDVAREAATGSSPLARGLPTGTVIAEGDGRDHPRSRGVYPGLDDRVIDEVGSSPLARGLRDSRQRTPPQRRIIPARAGFTPYPHDLRHISVDHPRSRGVYASRRAPLSRKAGSSPLARGLLRRGPGRRRRRTDHPRSRGVYPAREEAEAWEWGSSPLARGLRLPGLRPGGAGGIIPARAGFTSGRSSRTTSRRDHPRSRGVYFATMLSGLLAGGSSPLARGLRRSPTKGLVCMGIIPARAGFTTIPARKYQYLEDHPRSRGVYSLSRPS